MNKINPMNIIIYIIKVFVPKLSSKFNASGGNIAKFKRITGLPNHWGYRERKRELEREREIVRARAENKSAVGGGGGGPFKARGGEKN